MNAHLHGLLLATKRTYLGSFGPSPGFDAGPASSAKYTFGWRTVSPGR
jgi:hypothetical protein